MRFNKHGKYGYNDNLVNYLIFCSILDALLGPPFTHLQIPDDSIYLASSNGSDAPFLYTRAVETLNETLTLTTKPYRSCDYQYDGMMTGLGLELIQYALQVFKPSHVLAFMAPEGEDTIRKCLTTNSFGLSGALTPEEAENIYVRYMGNPTNDSPRGKHSPADQRNFAYWAYFFWSNSRRTEAVHFVQFQSPSIGNETNGSALVVRKQLASTCREIDGLNCSGLVQESEQMNLLESWLLMRLVGLPGDEIPK